MDSTLTFRTDVRPSDVQAVTDIVTSTGNFSAEEVAIAAELVQERLDKGIESGYFFVFGELLGKVVSYTCFGPIPATKSSYDLYWIATLKELHGKGVGKAVQLYTEQLIKQLGGTHVWIETSSRDDYIATRQFYLKTGATVAAILDEFYGPGDSKYVFLKRV